MNIETLLPVLAELLAKSSAVLLLATLLVRIWRGANSAQRHFIWLAALGTIMVLPATKLVAPRWSIPIEPAPKVSIVVPAESLRPLVLEDSPAPVVISAAPPIKPSLRALLPWRKILLALWLGGIVPILGYRLFGSWRLHRLYRRSTAVEDPRIRLLLNCTLSELGLRRRPEIRLSAECRVPVTWGWLRPVLLLPREALGWSDTWLTAALRHEAAHILRGDSLTRWVAWLACALYWPNPFIWLAAHSLRIAQEQAADDLVLRSGTPPEEYAAQLVDVARTVATHGVFLQNAVAMASPSTLEGRILAIVDGQRDRRPLSRLAAFVGSASVLLTLALCTAAQLQGADAPRPTDKTTSSPEPPVSTNDPQIEIYTKFVEITSDASKPAVETGYEQPTILSDPQLQIIIRALNQKKGVDLLSAPLLTTHSGVDSRIEIVRDFPVKNVWPPGSANPAPEDPAMKKVGVVMDFTPEVKAGGEIALHLQPTQTEFSGFRDLDDPQHPLVTDPAGKRVKPIFGEAKRDLNVTLHSEETVVFTLGDFKADGQPVPPDPKYHRQYLVFVSARLIEPAPQSTSADLSDPSDAARRGEADAEQIVIPQIEFRDATVQEAVEFLQKKSRELAGAKKPVEIVCGASPETLRAKLSIALKNIPLTEACRYIAGLADLPVKFAPGRITIGTAAPLLARPAAGDRALSPEESPVGQKALKIVLPKVEFREATVQEALDFLQVKAKENDPDHSGVNVILKLPAAPPADPSAINPADARITLSLTNIPLYEALKYVAGLSSLQLVVTPNALLLQPEPPGTAKPPELVPPLPLDPPPAAPGGAQVAPVPDAVITVDKSGGVQWNGEAVSADGLQKKLQELKAAKPAASPILRGNSDTPYKTVMDVLEKLERAGFTNVGLVHPPGAAVDGTNVTFTKPSAASTPASGLITKEWKIVPDWIPLKPGGNGQERMRARDWLIARGIVFEDGASAVFVAATSRLLVRNTPAQLDLVDVIIASAAAGPSGEINLHGGTLTPADGAKVADAGTISINGGTLDLKGATTQAPPPTAAKPGEKPAVQPVALEADSTRMENGVAIAEGHVRMTWGPFTITADTVRYDATKKTAFLGGKAEVVNGLNVVQAENVEIGISDDGQISIKGPHKTIIRNPASATDQRVDDPAVKGFTSLLQGEQLATDGKTAEAQEKLREAKQALNEVKASDAALRQRLAQLEQRLAEIKGGIPPTTGGAAKPALQGRVLAVNLAWNFAVLNMGAKAGVTKDAIFNVVRAGEPIARVRISSVEPSTSVGNILPESVKKDRAVLPGDTVLPDGVEIAPSASSPRTPQPGAESPSSPAAPSEAADAFVTAYMHVQKSGRLEAQGDKTGALRELEAAARLFDDIAKKFPTWQPQILEYRKLRTVQAMERLRGADSAGAAPAPRAQLELQAVRIEEKADENSARHLALHIPVKRSSGATIDPKEMVAHVLFYDMIDGREVKQTVAEVNSHWNDPPANWAQRDVEELVVDYRLPKAAAVTDQGGTRKYYGYLVRLYYAGQLQGNTTDQPRLLQQNPSPVRLP